MPPLTIAEAKERFLKDAESGRRQGAWTLVRLGFRPVAVKKVMTSSSNFESRSRMT
jgi:hypothetical protein